MIQPPYRIFVGCDVREDVANNIAQTSAFSRTNKAITVYRLLLAWVINQGLYRRPTAYPEDGSCAYWDEISGAPMSTGHAIARFLVPALCHYEGWALFTDGDVLFRKDLEGLFALADEQYAVQVVQHEHAPEPGAKMDGQVQTRYARKNWSSVMLFNCGHPANRGLSVDLVNAVPGRDLHRFCWLPDNLIGALPTEWNWLVGHSPASVDPSIVHFTTGTPDMPGYEDVPFAEEWRDVARSCGYRKYRRAPIAVPA